MLCMLWFECVVSQQISSNPYNSDHQECRETRTIVNHPDNGQHNRYPPDNIVRNHYQSVCGSRLLRGWHVVG